jgi:hypothetical protein
MTFKTIKEALVNPELVTKLSFRVSNSTAVADSCRRQRQRQLSKVAF